MNALILAAGKGSRLGVIGEETPKPLLEVGGKPILARHLENCARHGVRNVFINTHHLAEKIKSFGGDGSQWGLQITYSFEPLLLGTSGAVNSFRGMLGSEDFFVIYGDNLLEVDLSAMKAAHVGSGADATIALHHREDVSTSGMVVCDESGRINRFVEKPAPHERVSDLVNAGVYCLAPAVLDLIPTTGESDFGRDIFPRMLSEDRFLCGFVLESSVLPVDTPELLAQARQSV